MEENEVSSILLTALSRGIVACISYSEIGETCSDSFGDGENGLRQVENSPNDGDGLDMTFQPPDDVLCLKV